MFWGKLEVYGILVNNLICICLFYLLILFHKPFLLLNLLCLTLFDLPGLQSRAINKYIFQ